MVQEIINNFEALVYRKNWTQTEAATKIGCTQEHLSRIFRGQKNPSVKLLNKMEEILEAEK